MHKKERVSVDQFAFTTAEAGNYLACFSIDGGGKGLVVKLNLEWKIGFAAKDWDSIAKMEKIEVKYMERRFYTIFCIVLKPPPPPPF
jgi:p24 family protein delta-1